MTKLRRKISKDEISQSYDLKKLLDQNKVSKEQRDLFYQLVVDKIVDRTTGGKDINRKNFTPYSEKYAERKGVDVNSVDLVLTGDMLSSIERDQSVGSGRVKIKLDGDEAEKAYYHTTGGKVPIRDFFGFDDSDDLKGIIRQVKRLQPREQEQEQEQPGIDLAELRSIIDAIRVDFEEL